MKLKMSSNTGIAACSLKSKYAALSRPLQNCIAAFLITLVSMLLLWLVFPPRFTETNDDLIMSCFTYGYMGEYSARLVFINILIGYALKFCMLILPTVPWYAVAQIIVVFVSFWVITYLFLQKFEGFRALIPVMLIFLFFGYEFFCSLQFTKTAAAGVIAGFLLMFYAASEHRKWYTYFFAGLLALVGGLFRFRVFELMLIIAFGVGLALVLGALKNRDCKQILRLCIPFAILIAFSFGCDFFDEWQYNRFPEWESYAEFNRYRANLMDRGFPDYDENLELYESLGISRNDYELYTSANIADTECFTVDVLKALADAKSNKTIDLQFFKDCWYEISRGMIKYSFFPLLLIVFLVAVIGFRLKNCTGIFLVLYEGLAFLGVQIYFYYRNRYLQSRVDASIIFAICLVLILYAWNRELVLPNGKRVVACVGCIAIISTMPWQYTQYVNDANELRIGTSTQVRKLISSDKEHFYFYNASWSALPDKMYDVWQVAEKGCGSNCSVLGTWRFHTPMVQSKIGQYDISNPYRDIINNDNIYLLCTDNVSLNRVLMHIHEHYRTDVYAYQVKVIEEKYPIYLLSSGEPQIDTTQVVNASENIHYEINKREKDGLLLVGGYLYADNTNSFASNIYIGVLHSDGTESFYYTTQYQSEVTTDNMNGEYAAFTRGIPTLKDGDVLNLYLRTENGLYRIPTEK